MLFFWGLLPAAGATLRGSQVCSALRRLQRLGLAFGHPCTSLGRSTNGFAPAFFLRPQNFLL
ncbi:hypothetical protein OP864_10855 [Saprospira grandis]|nr:hypothetical protein [Saprospira grandis]WBM76297.1 hypothetical protein OP864_10855 [Saprospira grandis]